MRYNCAANFLTSLMTRVALLVEGAAGARDSSVVGSNPSCSTLDSGKVSVVGGGSNPRNSGAPFMKSVGGVAGKQQKSFHIERNS